MTTETKVVSGIVIATLIIIVGGLWLVSKQQGTGYAENKTITVLKDSLIRPHTPKLLATGSSTKKVQIVEFADLECPACAMLNPQLMQVLSKHKEDVDYYYRTVLIHPGSEQAIIYALAAGKQGKFFEYTDLVFKNQSIWTMGKNRSAYFEEYAVKAGVNIDMLKVDLKDPSFKKSLEDDRADATAMGINSTPTLIINDKVFTGVLSSDSLEKIIQEELQKTVAK